MTARAGRRSLAGLLRVDPSLLWQLGGLAVLAFVLRLIPVLLSGGLNGIIDYDDGVYMGTALSLVRGRIVYRDFFMLHPPGILYVLSPFAALSWFFSDATAFAAARVGFMLIGALNTFLVGLVASRYGRTAALATSALYAVWIVAAKVERSTWLVGPQNTLLLLTLLALTFPRAAASEQPPITWRKAAVVGVLIGLCGAIQIWGVVTAAVIFVWIFLRTVRQPGGWLRPVVAYSVAGLAALAISFLPFLAAAGEKMIRIVIFDQIGRGGNVVPIASRLRQMEGLPRVVDRLGLEAFAVVVYVVVVMAVVYVAWRRPGIRLWAALFVAQSAFLLITPSFFAHYGGWAAPAAALSVGSVATACIEWTANEPRRPRAIATVYAGGLACLMLVTLVPWFVGFPSPSRGFNADAVAELIKDARCPTADNPTVLILTSSLRRVLDNDCPLLVSPTGVSYDTDPGLGGKARTRPRQLEYQAVMQAYYGGSDAAMFSRNPKNDGLSAATWAVIRAQLPVERHRDQVMILLPAGSR